jgi:hypothetical protein
MVSPVLPLRLAATALLVLTMVSFVLLEWQSHMACPAASTTVSVN